MGRSSSQEILESIVSTLRDGGKSIKQITKACGAQRSTVRKYLQSLEDLELVEYEEQGRQKVYHISPEFLNLSKRSSGNYFGLQIGEEDEKKVLTLYNHIIAKWKQKTGKYPKKTELQKALAKINETSNLELPIGWYMYGEMCTVTVDPGKSVIEQEKLIGLEQVGVDEESIDDVVEEYSQFESVVDLMEHRYEDAGEELYIIKHKLQQEMLPNGADQSEVMGSLYRFVRHLPDIEDEETEELIDEFISIFSQLYGSEENGFLQSKLISLFDAVWRLIALYNYKEDLRSHHSEKELGLKFNIDIESQKREVLEKLENLQDFMPEPEIENDELSDLKGISKED